MHCIIYTYNLIWCGKIEGLNVDGDWVHLNIGKTHPCEHGGAGEVFGIIEKKGENVVI
jgi:glycine cleavage system protein P-like pyridoxal-binding family